MLDVCNTVGCINMHCFALGTMQHSKFKFASNANLAISMQVCTFAHELIYFNQAEISCNGGPCLQDMYSVCVLCAAPALADAQFVCCITACHQCNPTYSTLLQIFARHFGAVQLNYRLHVMCSNIKDKQNYWVHYCFIKLKHNLANPPADCSSKATVYLI